MNTSAMQIRGEATQPIAAASQLLPEEPGAKPATPSPMRLVSSAGQPAKATLDPALADPDATAIRAVTPKQQLIGSRVGTYLITERLGAGGAAEVFKGIDLMLKREVAIKVLRPENACDPSFPERFRREAQILARLSHPNIASVHAFVQEGETQFMVMEYVPGISLDTLIRTSGPVAPERAVSIVRAALEGIGHAHGCGIIHRDIKPANIMLTEVGQVKVVDFGIARSAEFDQHLTCFGQVPGTAKYMSPEQVRGEEVDTRSDIYSLGVVLYMLLSGRAPFDGKSVYDLMKSQVEQTPPPLQKVVAGVPAQLEAAVRRALAKHPADRFQSIDAFKGILDACLAEIRRPAPRPMPELMLEPTEIRPLPAKPAESALHSMIRQVSAAAGTLWSRIGTQWRHYLGHCGAAIASVKPRVSQAAMRVRHADRRVLAALFAAPLVAGGLLGALVLHPVMKGDARTVSDPSTVSAPTVEPDKPVEPVAAPQPAPVVAKSTLAITRQGVNSEMGHVFKPGERIALRIQPSQDAYVYCYLQDENARIVRFFPNRFQKSALVKADAPLQVPGTMAFELVANPQRVRETVACFASERDITAQLPASAVGTDFDNLPVASLDQLASSFAAAGGADLVQASFPILFD